MATVKLVDYTSNPEVQIGRMAAICYDSDTSPEACIRRAKHCVSSGHLATLRFAYATFNISGISRICSHQLVRTTHLEYLQRSQRYCEESDVELIQPDSLGDMSPSLKHNWATHEQMARDLYAWALKEGMRKEDARFILPQSTTTELYVTGNFQAWLDFINLRDQSAAQWEIRAVAQQIRAHLAHIAPNIFS